MADHTLPTAYVLWFGPTGLTIARALAKRGVPVVAVHGDSNEVCLATRSAKAVVLPPLSNNPDVWLSFLLEEGKRLAPLRGVLFPASDEHWLFLAKYRDALQPYFRYPMPVHNEPALWPTKSFQYEAARKFGIPYPATFRPRNEHELQVVGGEIKYPCLIKPDLSHEWVRIHGEKLSFVRSQRELRERGLDALARGLSFIVQEFIPAPDHEVYGLYSYLDEQSKPLGWGVSRKVRQHEPYFGSSCLSRSVIEPRVVELGFKLLQGMKFHGISSVEFKRDPRDGEFKLMEINVRSPLLMSSVVLSGVNLPYLAYCNLLDLPIKPRESVFRPGRRVGLLMNDLHSAAFYCDRGELTWLAWSKSWIGTRDVHFAWNDPRPFIRYAKTLLRRWQRGKYRVRYAPESACMTCSEPQFEKPELPVIEMLPTAKPTIGA